MDGEVSIGTQSTRLDMAQFVIYEDNGGGDRYSFLSNAYDLNSYHMGSYYFDWNDEVSSLYTSSSIYVFEGAGYSGFSALLAPGFHDLASLESYGIYNDSIPSIAFF
jgi:hypothetical protein